jgi:type I restriction enzyme, R subunit
LRKLLRLATPSLTQTTAPFTGCCAMACRWSIGGRWQHRGRPCAAGGFREAANDWLAVNQFTVIEGQHNRRPDIVVFVNGLPLGLIELKNAADEGRDDLSAYAQLQTYKARSPRCCTTTRRWW